MTLVEDPSLDAWLRLTLIPGVGSESQRKLLTAFGLPEAVFSAGYDALRCIVGSKTARLLLEADNSQAVAAARQWAQASDQHIVTLADAAYPRALLDIADPPTLIYVRGRLDLLQRPTLAIVGSRNPTPQGIKNAENFSAALAQSGLIIVSGLALGIDTAAHLAALSVQGDTIAVIGTGIDRIYPARNLDLARRIVKQGCIISEFPLGTPAVAHNFPRRNRLISGLARGVLVVEAAAESGSLITARLAGEQGKEVFSIPGSIHSPQARGCHKLIKQGAKLVETVQDILEELDWHDQPSEKGQASAFPLPTPSVTATGQEAQTDADELLALIGFDPCSIDELAARSGLSIEILSQRLLQLELDGHLANLPGGRFQRISA